MRSSPEAFWTSRTTSRGRLFTRWLAGLLMFLLAPMGGVARADERVPAPIEIKILDSNQTLYFQGAYSNPQGFGNGVWSIGHQRQGGTYEVPLELKNISAGEDLGLFVSVVLAADDWIVEQDPSGSVVDVGESAYARIRLDTSAPMAAPSICAIQLIITQGSTSYDPILIVLRAESVQAIDAMDQDGVPEIKELTPGDGPASPMGAGGWTLFSVPDRMPAANFVHAPHAFIGWNLDDNAASTDPFYLGVHAAIEGGINKVEFYLKGNTVTITNETIKPESQSAEDVPGFYIKIRRESFSVTDPTPYKVWARAFANDPNQKPRVIGPWDFWVFPSNTTPWQIPCESSLAASASTADGMSALWRVLADLSSNFKFYTDPTGGTAVIPFSYPPEKPVILLLSGAGNRFHILPSEVNEYKVSGLSGYVGVSNFNQWQVPIVLMPEPESTNAPKLRPTLVDPPVSSHGSPARSQIRAPTVIFKDLLFDQKFIASIKNASPLDTMLIPTDDVFLDCEFTCSAEVVNVPDLSGRFALFTADHVHATTTAQEGILPRFLPDSADSVSDTYFENCWRHDLVEGCNEGRLVRGCTMERLVSNALHNVHAAMDVVISDMNPQPYLRDMPIGTLTYNGPAGGGIVKVGDNGSVYKLADPPTHVARGALLLFEGPGDEVPKHVIALGIPAGSPVNLPNWDPLPSWHPVATISELQTALSQLDPSPFWSYASSTCSELANVRSTTYLSTTCVTGLFPAQPGGTPPGQYPIKLSSVPLTTQIDVHQDAIQIFRVDGLPPLDNVLYWGIDYDYKVDPVRAPPNTDPFPCFGGANQPANPTCHTIEYNQGFFIEDLEEELWNSAFRAIRLRMAPDGVMTGTSSQLASPLRNVLLANFTIQGQEFLLRDDPAEPNPGKLFSANWVSIRNSYFEHFSVLDVPIDIDCAQGGASANNSMYTVGELVAANNHYRSACGLTTVQFAPILCSGSYSGPITTIAYATWPLNNGGCSWGYGPLLSQPAYPNSTGGRPLTGSPLRNRKPPIVTKYYLDGKPVLPCGSGVGPAIGAKSPEGQP